MELNVSLSTGVKNDISATFGRNKNQDGINAFGMNNKSTDAPRIGRKTQNSTTMKFPLSYSCSSSLEHGEVQFIIGIWLGMQLGIEAKKLKYFITEYKLQGICEYMVMNEEATSIKVSEAERSRLHIDLDDYLGMSVLHWDPISWTLLSKKTSLEPIVDHRGMIVVNHERMRGMSAEDLYELRSEVEDAVVNGRRRGSVVIGGEGSHELEEIAVHWNWTSVNLNARLRGRDRIPLPLIYKMLTPPSSSYFGGLGYLWLLHSLNNIYKGGMPVVSYHSSPSSNNMSLNQTFQLAIRAYREVVRQNNPYLHGMEGEINIGSDGVVSFPVASPSDFDAFKVSFTRLRDEIRDNSVSGNTMPGYSEIIFNTTTPTSSADTSLVSLEVPTPSLPPCRLVLDGTRVTAFLDEVGISSPLIILDSISEVPREAKNIVENLWIQGYFTTLWGHYMWNVKNKVGILYFYDPLRYRDWNHAISSLSTL